MLTKINRLTGVGVFRNFQWPAEFEDFSRYNVIYGNNGTGKSTLSRVIQAYATGVLEQGEAVVTLDGKAVRPGDGDIKQRKIRVFNRDFVERNILASVGDVAGGTDIPAILVIGQEGVEAQKKINSLREAREVLQADLEGKRAACKAAEASLEQLCQDTARDIKTELQLTGSQYNNFDKADYKKRADSFIHKPDELARGLSEADIADRKTRHRAQALPRIAKVKYDVPDGAAIHATAAMALSETITATAVIPALRSDPSLAAWISQGMVFLDAKTAPQCPLCEQPFPVERLKLLEAHFSDAHKLFVQKMEASVDRLRQLADATDRVTIPQVSQFYAHLHAEYHLTESQLRADLKNLHRFFHSTANVLRDKKKRPFEAIALTIENPNVQAGSIDAMNALIQKHNAYTDEFDREAASARHEIANHRIMSTLSQYISRRETLGRAVQASNAVIMKLAAVESELALLEQRLHDHHPPATELNKNLRDYLGHDELMLEATSAGYQLRRNKQIATRMSEGEITAIALMYFLQSLRSKDFDLTQGIVVLDDPVCSLDSTSMYVAFGYIQTRTQDARQLFIFTHSFSFLRLVIGWFKHFRTKEDLTRHCMVRCSFANGVRQSDLSRLAHLLWNYESDYHFNFSIIYWLANGSRGELNDFYQASNTARKVLEAFASFQCPGAKPDNMHDSLKHMTFDLAKKVRILRYVNNYSHSASFTGHLHEFTSIAEAKEVLVDLLELIKTNNLQHYQQMEQLTLHAKKCDEKPV